MKLQPGIHRASMIMTYREAEDYLYSLSNLPRSEYMNNPRACRAYLKRVQLLLNILGNPEKQIPHYIHVAGTSGKGSVCHFLHNIMGASGVKSGLYVTPHPTELTERWKIGKQQMSKKTFIELTQTIQAALDTYAQTAPEDLPSFFEVTTAMGLYWFAGGKVEWLIFETGCGGRSDSTNVLPYKDAAVITNIGLDHTDIFGTDLRDIAKEKAGIIPKAKLVVTQERNPKLLNIIRREAGKKVFIHSNPLYEVKKQTIYGSAFIYRGQKYHIRAAGEHQIKNAILAIDTAQALGVPSKAIRQGLEDTKMPIRMEAVSKNPLIILDSAHNPDKMKTTVKTMLSLFDPKRNNLHLLLGFSENKPVGQMLRGLAVLNPKQITATRNSSHAFRKVADPRVIAKQLKRLAPQTKTEIFLEPFRALKEAKKKLKKDDILLITGSVFLSGQLRARF